LPGNAVLTSVVFPDRRGPVTAIVARQLQQGGFGMSSDKHGWNSHDLGWLIVNSIAN